MSQMLGGSLFSDVFGVCKFDSSNKSELLESNL